MGIYLSEPVTKKDVRKGGNGEVSYAVGEMQGWRKNMEDSSIDEIDLGDGNSLFGIFDGHGGAEVSTFVKRQLGRVLLQTQQYQAGKYIQALDMSFQTIDVLLSSYEGDEALVEIRKALPTTQQKYNIHNIANSTGCTANVILITQSKIYVANCGDSRSVLCRDGMAVALSQDHKPQSAEEEKRVVKAGGVIEDGRVNGGLNLTRSLGDLAYKRNDKLDYKEQMITCYPDIRQFDRTHQDQFIVSGCDGVWERFVDNSQGMIDLIREDVKKTECLGELVECLLDELIAQDTKTGVGCDNMTVILIKLS